MHYLPLWLRSSRIISTSLKLQRVIYSGGSKATNDTRFSEPGYIAIPDCMWGSAEFGLEQPLNLTDVPLHMVKTSNATWGHYGEMAGGQPWVFKN